MATPAPAAGHSLAVGPVAETDGRAVHRAVDLAALVAEAGVSAAEVRALVGDFDAHEGISQPA